MLLDEEQLKEIASHTSIADAVAEAETRKIATSEADKALAGLHVELDAAIEKHQKLAGQRGRRLIDSRKDKEAYALKYFTGSSKASTEDAVNVYMRAAAEDIFMADVLKLSQQAIDAARVAVASGEKVAMKADLAHQQASVVVLAIQHEVAVAELLKSDPGLQINYGPKITTAMDRLAETTITLSKKERGI